MSQHKLMIVLCVICIVLVNANPISAAPSACEEYEFTSWEFDPLLHLDYLILFSYQDLVALSEQIRGSLRVTSSIFNDKCTYKVIISNDNVTTEYLEIAEGVFVEMEQFMYLYYELVPVNDDYTVFDGTGYPTWEFAQVPDELYTFAQLEVYYIESFANEVAFDMGIYPEQATSITFRSLVIYLGEEKGYAVFLYLGHGLFMPLSTE